MRNRRHIEREFGVPIAGEIREPAHWTQTALKKLPGQDKLHWETLFGRRAPVILDLGCGNGRYLIGSAVWRPNFDHLGIDILPVVIRYATRRANQRGLTNIRFAVGHARNFLLHNVEPASAAEIHCYHPQPYYDPNQAELRLCTPEFLLLIRRSLSTEGVFYLQTDNPGYWQYLQKLVPVFFDFREQTGRWPDAPKGRTRREIIALRRGMRVFRGTGTVRPGISDSDALHLAEALPPPIFDADQQYQELDELERSGA
jgi:tRNA (guanine-N7-)-methyltransferase